MANGIIGYGMASWIKKDGWLKGYVKEKPEQKTRVEEVIEEHVAVYGVTYYPLKCPKCQSKDIKTYSSKPPIRYHRCKLCDFRFRSIEAEEKQKIAKAVV